MSTLLNVIIVLGIVIAGSFLLFFLGDFFLSVIDAKRKNAGEESVYHEEPRKEFKSAQKTSMYVTDYIAEEAKEIQEEKKEEAAPAPAPVATPVMEEEEEDTASEEEERRIAEARAALERRKAEILKRMQAQIEEDDEEEEEELEEEEEEPAPIPTPIEEEEHEEKEGMTVGLIEEEEEEEEKIDTSALEAEIAALKNQLGAEKEKYEALEREFEEHKNTVVEPTIVEVEGETIGSRDYYEKMLEEKTAQLKLVEKEYKQCKKDFLPLYRVHNTLAKDEKKLHRREAIVAKQKVVLYGVNNYADIDEEKAKKLAEDLDLLDGLKLSVSHCKEVMAKNQERYPILERLYNSLKTQVEGLKAEIENIKTILEGEEESAE